MEIFWGRLNHFFLLRGIDLEAPCGLKSEDLLDATVELGNAVGGVQEARNIMGVKKVFLVVIAGLKLVFKKVPF